MVDSSLRVGVKSPARVPWADTVYLVTAGLTGGGVFLALGTFESDGCDFGSDSTETRTTPDTIYVQSVTSLMTQRMLRLNVATVVANRAMAYASVNTFWFCVR